MEASTAPMNTHPSRERHGNRNASRPRRLGISSGQDPFLRDQLAAATALAHDMATGSVKRLAIIGAVSTSTASRWRTEGKGGPLFDVTRIVHALAANGEHPGAIIGHLMTTMYQALAKLDNATLARRTRALMQKEAEAEGEENKATQCLGWTRDYEACERALLDEASVQLELAAHMRECRLRGLDPLDAEWD